MTRARRLMLAFGGFWLVMVVVPGWVIGGFLVIAITGVLLEARPTPWAAGLLFVAFDLAWLAATVAMTRLVIRRTRASRRRRFIAP